MVLSSTFPKDAADRARSRRAIDEATAAMRAGNALDAEQTLNRRLFERPDDVEATAVLADMLNGQGRHLEASLLYKRALTCAPREDGLRLALARSLQRQNQLDSAIAEIEKLGAPMRASFEARIVEAALLGRLGLHDRELPLYQALLSDHPDHEALWMSYGLALKTVGRTEEAVAALRQAIRCRPTYGEAYWTLANLKTFRFEDRDLAAMQRMLRKTLAPADALHFHFALGKAFEDRNDAERSFRHYAAGNGMVAARFSSEQMSAAWFVDSAVQTFDRDMYQRHRDAGHRARDPIFVVGLQRSGSTLIEQILASHPQIEGTAELPVVEEMWMRLARVAGRRQNPFEQVRQLSSQALDDLGAEYLERTRAYRHSDRPYFVDKQPGNWMHVGFIKLILPNARIVDARRHPMACGFSNFRQFYPTGVIFSYSLETIGRFYADYLRLMRHFDAVLPGAVHHVINERLIDDPENAVRALLDYVGVPFDPACLEFHKTRRAVHSASSEQVRRPINREGVDYWRRYQPWLGPLETALGSALVDWDK